MHHSVYKRLNGLKNIHGDYEQPTVIVLNVLFYSGNRTKPWEIQFTTMENKNSY